MRGILTVLAMLVLGAFLVGAQTQTTFLNGKVSFYDGSQITVYGMTYTLAQKCSVVIQTQRNGLFSESPGTLRDVRTGISATIHINGNVIDQVIIERWKQ